MSIKAAQHIPQENTVEFKNILLSMCLKNTECQKDKIKKHIYFLIYLTCIAERKKNHISAGTRVLLLHLIRHIGILMLLVCSTAVILLELY